MDVTRKVINLARECGNKIELSAVDTGAACTLGYLAIFDWRPTKGVNLIEPR